MHPDRPASYIILIVFFLCPCTLSFAQESISVEQARIHVNFNNAPLTEVFNYIEEQTKYKFVYQQKIIDNAARLTTKDDTVTVASILLKIANKTGWSFKQINDNITIRSKEASPQLVEVNPEMPLITGRITNTEGIPLSGAAIKVIESDKGATTDFEGNYSLVLPQGKYSLEGSYVGYQKEIIEIFATNEYCVEVNFTLAEKSELNGVVITGTRTFPLLQLDSPVPVDNVSGESLAETGFAVLDQQLMFQLPAYNSTQQPISDAGAHFNTSDLKGLYSSRTLVLLNGKRKNPSALVYSYVTPGRGEVGVDMKSIPTAAIDHVEVLRDGAAAQYGSDAVAGVINLVLKKKSDPFINYNFSSTTLGDGQQSQVETGFGVDIAKRGYANFTFNYFNQNRTQRAGDITSAEDEAAYWGTSIYSLDDYRSFLARNPKAGTQVGLPDMTITNVVMNTGYTLSEHSDTKIYAFGSHMSRNGSAPQFTRVPYWVTGFEAVYPGKEFFLPEIAPEIKDQTLTLGLKTTFDDWDFDFSSTIGRSRIDYFIVNSFNQSFGAASPTDFYNGAHQFTHLVNNIDIIKTFRPLGIKAITVAFGAENRNETFETEEGQYISYADGTPNDPTDRTGSESFPGFTPENASKNFRSNIGAYSEITTEFSQRLLLGSAMRFENYSDFGSNVSWKLNSRLVLIKDKLNLRGAVSSGFRAPALHQIYYTAITTTLTTNGIVQNGILDNNNPALRALGIPKLTPETSFNIGSGITYRLNKNMGVAVDLYQIDIKDRIVLSGQVTSTGDPSSPIDVVLNSVNTSSAGFFLNAVDTETHGIDVVFNLDDISVGKGVVSGIVAGNFNHTRVKSINLPDFIESNNLSPYIFSREDISRMETWRPRQKMLATINYKVNKFSARLSSMYFGAVTYRHSSNTEDDRTYGGKTLTDISLSYQFGKSLHITLGSNNIFNVYPDELSVTTDRNVDFVGRFKYPWKTTQFGIDGTRIFTQVRFTF